MNVRSMKAKGARLQKKVIALILEKFPELTGNDIHSASSGQNGSDVIFSEKALKILPFSIECKNQESPPQSSWWRQAKSNAGKNITPVLVVSRNREEIYVLEKSDEELVTGKSSLFWSKPSHLVLDNDQLSCTIMSEWLENRRKHYERYR